MATLMQVEKRYESKDRYDQMTDEELVALAQSGETQAEEYLIRKYERMVQVWSRPYFLQGAEDDDLLQEGRIGLLRLSEILTTVLRTSGLSPSFALFAISSAPSKELPDKSTFR